MLNLPQQQSGLNEMPSVTISNAGLMVIIKMWWENPPCKENVERRKPL